VMIRWKSLELAGTGSGIVADRIAAQVYIQHLLPPSPFSLFRGRPVLQSTGMLNDKRDEYPKLLSPLCMTSGGRYKEEYFLE
jgi:hypothetical protein